MFTKLTYLIIIFVVTLITSAIDVCGQETLDASAKAVKYREMTGRRMRFECPANLVPKPIWGTGVYTDDSSVCTAAVHAGAINAQSGGTVAIEIRPGAASYKSSVRNGIESAAYGKWEGSFVFVSNKVPASNEPPANPEGLVRLKVNWDSRMTEFRGQVGLRVLVSCPASERTIGPLWGTDTYSDDSAVCLAGVHSGVITSNGGDMMIEIQAGSQGYGGTTRNGVPSYSFGQWPGSFTVVHDPALKKINDCTFSARLLK